VTGGAGFIGSNFVHRRLRLYPDDHLVVLDALTYAGNLANLEALKDHPRMHFVHGDIRDSELVGKLLREHVVDTIVHFAAESHVDRSIDGPDVFVDVNINGTHSLLKAARDVWLEGDGKGHRFHHVSTDEVYGSLEPGDPMFTESTPYAPNSPYAASKAASDHLVRAYQHTYGLETTISNCSNNYGPFQFPEKLLPLCVVNLLEGKELPIYGDGKNVRDWLHVEDHCAGIDAVIERGKPAETYNIGGNQELTNLEIVGSLCDALDRVFAEQEDLEARFPAAPRARGEDAKSRITFVKDRPGHDRRYAIDAGKIAGELGFEPSITFAEGLESTIRWYLEHEIWWRSLLDGSYRDWVDSWYQDR
jgi:dTDP-glucose 4,6-dehydratase